MTDSVLVRSKITLNIHIIHSQTATKRDKRKYVGEINGEWKKTIYSYISLIIRHLTWKIDKNTFISFIFFYAFYIRIVYDSRQLDLFRMFNKKNIPFCFILKHKCWSLDMKKERCCLYNTSCKQLGKNIFIYCSEKQIKGKYWSK